MLHHELWIHHDLWAPVRDVDGRVWSQSGVRNGHPGLIIIIFVICSSFAPNLGVFQPHAGSSMLSCIAFGQICDHMRMNRLSFNQGSVLLAGLLYLLIPVLTPYGSLIVFGVLLGITDAGNCILRPVLTFDLMGADGECQ